jgi:hypothetical protein
VQSNRGKFSDQSQGRHLLPPRSRPNCPNQGDPLCHSRVIRSWQIQARRCFHLIDFARPLTHPRHSSAFQISQPPQSKKSTTSNPPPAVYSLLFSKETTTPSLDTSKPHSFPSSTSSKYLSTPTLPSRVAF